MNPDQRQAVLDNARYLRSVRPVDPDEIYEYVEGQPHPAVVRQTLREAAVELGLVEREDGTFVPASDEPLTLAFDGVERLPERHERAFADLLVERYGPDWPHGESGERLRETVRRFKQEYFETGTTEYDAETALAYACYHLPAYYAVAAHALAELAREDLLPGTLRVLDVGAGVGGPALALLDLLPEGCLVEYHALEPTPAADVFEALVEPGRNQRVVVHREHAEAFAPEGEGPFDLLLFANVLSELDDPAAVVDRYMGSLAEDGSALLLAPADLNTATGLRRVERALCDEGPYTAYAPTVRLWSGQRPTDRGWSFTVKPDIAVPEFQRRLDEAAGSEGEFVNVDVQYAYSVLRRDGRRRIDVSLPGDRYARMADAEGHVTDRIDCVVAKLSHDLGERNPLFKISDGSESRDHYAVVTKATALNEPLLEAPYGALLAIENGLLLWNDDEDSYNLVVDAETVVDYL